MGRLIDTDVLMADVRNTITEESGAIDWINLINRQPTAYDPDKVVEQLEELHERYLNEYGLIGNHGLSALNRAIEIVKGGGVDGD